MGAIIQGNGKTDLGTSGTPWTNVYATNLYQGGVAAVVTTDSRLPVADEKAALAGSSGTPSASNKYVTAADRTRKWISESIVGLTGGGATKLDGYATTGVTVGLILEFIDDNSGNPITRTYQLVAGTDAESSPNIIRPDDYDGGSNAKVWKLRTGSGTHASEHIDGGDDEIDADKLVVTFVPTNYTPDGTTPDEADADDQLTAHFQGIDTALADVLTTRTGVYRTIKIGAHQFIADTGTPTLGDADFGTILMRAAQLSDAALKAVMMVIRLPDEWDSAVAPKFKLEWASGTGTGYDVVFEVSGRLLDDGGDLTAVLGAETQFTSTAAGDSKLEVTAACTPTLAGSGRTLILRVERVGTDAADNFTGIAYLTAVYCQYKEGTTEPSSW